MRKYDLRKYESDVRYTVSDIGEHTHIKIGITWRIIFTVISAVLWTFLCILVTVGKLAVIPSIILALVTGILMALHLLLLITTIYHVNYVVCAVLDNNLSAAKEKLLGLR